MAQGDRNELRIARTQRFTCASSSSTLDAYLSIYWHSCRGTARCKPEVGRPLRAIDEQAQADGVLDGEPVDQVLELWLRNKANPAQARPNQPAEAEETVEEFASR
jgi:hypothetical protein